MHSEGEIGEETTSPFILTDTHIASVVDSMTKDILQEYYWNRSRNMIEASQSMQEMHQKKISYEELKSLKLAALALDQPYGGSKDTG